jgi:nitroreductase
MPSGEAQWEEAMDDPVLSRRSIRKYTKQEVPEELVERLLRAAMSAPSASNQQPWHFIVARDHELLDRVPDVHPYSSMVPSAPLAIVVCGDPRNAKWPQMWEQDCSAATENVLVEAQLLGLGAVWLGVHPLSERVEGLQRLFGIPSDVIPFSLIPIGFPAEQKPPADRYLVERVHQERW